MDTGLLAMALLVLGGLVVLIVLAWWIYTRCEVDSAGNYVPPRRRSWAAVSSSFMRRLRAE